MVNGEEEGGGCSISLYPDCVLAPWRLEHAHERRGALSVEFSLGVGWSARVPYFGSVVFAFP
jgi:hypothetical protein